MKYKLSVTTGVPYQRFSVNVDGHSLSFALRWLQNYSYFAVDIYENGEPVTLGKGLNPDINLVRGLNTALGAIYLSGSQPTIDNLGVSNMLVYDDAVIE